jgi:hypothetical protein
MRLFVSSLGLAALFPLAAGCLVDSGGREPGDDEVGAAVSAQVDEDQKSYTITQSSVTVASAWAGVIGLGTKVEYWVAKPGYQSGATRAFSGASQTCSAWKSGVCGTGWSGATYYKATYTEEPLDCEYPPDPCQPPAGAVSFLANGSYRTSTTLEGNFAWTYVSGGCEHWAMNHLITNGTSTQLALRSNTYTSLTDFHSTMCAMSTPPSTWFTAAYEEVADFCASSTC